MFFLNVGWKIKILKVKSAVMKSYLHVLVVLAIHAKIADANFHYTKCDMAKLQQNVIWISTIRMGCKHTRVWIQDICKKSTVLTKSIGRTLYSVLTLLSMIDLHAMLTKYTCTWFW